MSRDDEALNCQPASEKGNVSRLRPIVDCCERCLGLGSHILLQHGADFAATRLPLMTSRLPYFTVLDRLRFRVAAPIA